VFFLAHAARHAIHGRAPDVLWMCTLAALLVGVGGLARSPRVTAVGVSWLAFGVPLWLLDVCGGGELFATSVLTHLGGLGIGIALLLRTGYPRRSYATAFGASVAVLGLSRLVTPRAANVNLVFAVPNGWESTFPSHPLYLAMLLWTSLCTFVLVERLCLRFFPKAPGTAP
jgi:hypothetical protein